MTPPSKFLAWRKTVEKEFLGPYPLDRWIISALVQRLPGLYIWYETISDIPYGYVGKSNHLADRLREHARQEANARFYFSYRQLQKLEALEEIWIDRAGDLNKISASQTKKRSGFYRKIHQTKRIA